MKQVARSVDNILTEPFLWPGGGGFTDPEVISFDLFFPNWFNFQPIGPLLGCSNRASFKHPLLLSPQETHFTLSPLKTLLVPRLCAAINMWYPLNEFFPPRNSALRCGHNLWMTQLTFKGYDDVRRRIQAACWRCGTASWKNKGKWV